MNQLMNIITGLVISFSLMAPVSTWAQKAPDFTLPGINKNISLETYRGKVVYIDFWASWCDPCRKSFPWLNEMQARYGKDGFRVLAINLDESRELADEFLTRIPAHFDVAYDPHGRLAEAYGLKVMPSSYLVDQTGNLVYIHRGFRGNDMELMESKIRQLVATR